MCSPVHLSVDLRVVPASRLFPVQPPAPFTSESVWTLALVSRGGRPVGPPARTAAPCVTVREAAQPFPVATPPHVQQHCPRGPVPPRRCHAGCGRASAGPASATSWLWPGPPRRTPVPTASRAGAHCVSASAGRVSGPCRPLTHLLRMPRQASEGCRWSRRWSWSSGLPNAVRVPSDLSVVKTFSVACR